MKYLKIPMDKLKRDSGAFCPGHFVKGEITCDDKACDDLYENGCTECFKDFLDKYTIEEEEGVIKFECTACSTKPCKVEIPKGEDYHEPLNCLYQDNVKTNWKEV